MRDAVVLLLSFALVVTVMPVTFSQSGPVYEETYDDPTLPGWELAPEATVTNGVLQIPGGSFAFFHGEAPDFTLSLPARFTSSQGEITLHYRAEESGAYQVVIGRSYLMLMLSGSTLLGATDVTPLETWFDIGVTAQGSSHAISINGQPVLTAADDSHLSGSGISLQTVGEGVVAEFDDFRWTAESEALPTQEQNDNPPDTDTLAASPAYEASSWVKLGGPPGGLGYDIRLRPDNPDVMYVTDARAGLFKSVDGGLIWQDTIGNLEFGPDVVAPIFCATIDPHNYDVIWIGTQINGHLYRSTDSGQSWETRDNGITHEGRSLRGITIDPNNASIVYVGLEVEVGMWQHEHPEALPGTVGGEVYKSTDTGLSWTRIWQGPNVARYIWVDPSNSNRVYVSTGIFDRIPSNANPTENDPGGVGILRSDDGGQTWTVLDERNGLGGRIIPSLFMHPTNPDILIAAVYMGGKQGGVYVTRNGGDTWDQALQYHMGIHNVEISTSNTDIWYAATENVAFRSDDAGETWEEFPLRTFDRLVGMPIDLQVDPRDPYRIFVNNYGGSNFLSTDGGSTWVDASQGYTGATVRVSMLPDDVVLADANTAIFRSDDGGSTWVGLTHAEEATPAVEQSVDLLHAQGGYVLHSNDQGTTWFGVQVVDLFAEFGAGHIANDALASILAVAPSDPRIVYLTFVDHICAMNPDACFQSMPGFFRSSDGGYTWEEVPGGPFEEVSALRIVVHPQDNLRLYVAAPGGLYESDDGGDTWQLNTALVEVATQVAIWDPGNPIAQSNTVIITDVALDPFDPNVLYAAALERGLFRSSNGGVTWHTATYGMDANENILVLVPDPNRPGVIYAGSRWSGVFVSSDGAQTWQRINEGLMKTPIISLALSEDGPILYAGTDSAGVWRLGGD